MKTLKSKLLMLTLLLIGVVAMSFAFSNKEKPEVKTEVKTEVKPEVKASIAWRYKGTSTAEGQFRQATNWEPGTSSAPGCGPNGGIPCQLTADAVDREELGEYLAGMDNAAVLSVSDTKRN